MPECLAPVTCLPRTRRTVLRIMGGSLGALAAPHMARAQDTSRTITLGLTPVFLNNDLELLSELKAYLEASLGQSVKLVLRRTYEEITSLLVSGQLDAAWICGYPFVEFRDQLDLIAVPVWRGKPLYQSYIIAGAGSPAASIVDLRGSVMPFQIRIATLVISSRLRCWPNKAFGLRAFSAAYSLPMATAMSCGPSRRALPTAAASTDMFGKC